MVSGGFRRVGFEGAKRLKPTDLARSRYEGYVTISERTVGFIRALRALLRNPPYGTPKEHMAVRNISWINQNLQPPELL